MRAYGKINVGLWIRNKRSDGYHNLETIFLPIDLYDEISIRKSNRFRMVGPNFGEDDLMNKAHRYLEKRFGALPVEITIEKHIPVGAGLAGGTSDGAAVLKGVRDLYNLPLTDEALIREAAALGADFPYCLYGKPAVGKGIGDILSPIRVPSYPALLVNPGFSVSTRDAYRAYRSSSGGSYADAVLCLRSGDLEGLEKVTVNDLMKDVASTYDVIEAMRRDLYDAGAAFAQMTGSGPTVYGLFTEEAVRNEAYRRLKKIYPQVFKTRTRGEDE